MAGRGPAPKENRVRRNADPVGTITLSDPPANPPKLRGYAKYSAPTRDWWDAWVKSPMAGAFLPTDWQRLMMLAPLVEEYYKNPKPSLLAEIRLNEERLGGTILDRRRGGLEVAKRDERPKLAPVADIEARRKSLED